jgi:hypothetical protein
MNNALSEHPAVLFGQWLRNKRRDADAVAREFAGRVDLSPAEYAEVELGIDVGRWITPKQQNLICIMLNLDETGEAELNYKLDQARSASRIQFGDVFTRDQLTPVRCSTLYNEQIDEKKREEILDAVFKPLE